MLQTSVKFLKASKTCEIESREKQVNRAKRIAIGVVATAASALIATAGSGALNLAGGGGSAPAPSHTTAQWSIR
jgi:hypothetical protein